MKLIELALNLYCSITLVKGDGAELMLNFQTLFESIPGLYIVYSLDLIIVAGSDAYFQTTKTKREEVVGQHLFEVFPDNPDDPNATGVQNLRASLESVLKHRQPHTIAMQKYDIPRPESEGGGFEERYWTLTNSPVFDENGEMTHIIHQAEAVTDFVRVQQQRNEQDFRKQAAQALQASEQQLKLALKTSKLGSWQLDIKTNVLSTSDQCKVNYGLPINADFSHKVLMERIHPEDRTWVQVAIQDTINTKGTDYDVEYRTVWDDGSTHWVLVRGHLIYDEAGNPERMVGISIDISDRKQTEETLRESEQQLRAIYDGTHEYIGLLTLDGTLLEANRALLEFADSKRDELIGLPFWETVWFQYTPNASETVRQAVVRAAAGEFVRLEAPIINPFGETMTFDISLYPIRNEKGEVILIVPEGRNITDRKQTEADLREAHVQLESALAAGAIYTWRWKIPDNLVIVNATFAHLFGVDPVQAATGLPIDLFVQGMHEEDRPRVVAAINQAIETGEEFVSEYRVYTAVGEERWLAARGRVEYAADGRPLAFPGALADITERKQAEDAWRLISAELERQLRKFDAIASSVTDFIYTFDLSGRFTYINQPLLDLLKKTSAEALGKNFFELDYPKDLATKLQRQIQQVIEMHQPLKDETPYTSAFGTRAYEYIFVPLESGNGMVEAVAGVTRDITDRKEIEATVKASNERLKLLSEVANDLLLNEDPKLFLAGLFEKVSTHLGLEVYFNYLFQEDQQRLQLHTHGGISEEIALSVKFLELGQGVCGYVVQHQKPAIVENALSKTDPLAVQVQSIGARAYACHPLMVGDACGGQSHRILGTLGLGTRQRDRFTSEELDLMQTIANQVAAALERSRLVTELQARAEALDRTNRIKDEFLAVLSHELRTPLNPILGWSKLLQKGKLDAEKTNIAIATIERNAQLQVQLIDDLLDISRILQGKMSLSTSPIDLNVVISAALETVRLAAEAKSIQIQTIVSPVLGVVVGDAGRLQQVVWNLLSNAVKFTPIGGQVTIALSQVENHAQIQITDTGKGIRADFLPFVFEHFRQEDSATTRKFGGLGLGLAIVRQITQMHGGTVTVVSRGEELGATFTVQIPLAPQLSEAPTLDRSPVEENDLSGIHILVVDDETDSREFITFVLEEDGAIVTAVASGTDALQAIAQSIPNIIVSDIGMPEMDGYMLMRQIRALGLEQGGKIPAIALTAYAAELDRQQAIAAGFQRHITKPIDPEVLVAIVVEMWASSLVYL
ncbi:PAS domain S-box protein [Nostoc sp.]|uniref:PAS domain S-box protein n=1 Tax=Nostoc sp. TaxID=1180 RepID=UPI002FF8D2D6